MQTVRTADRRSRRRNFEQEPAEVTEIKNWDAKGKAHRLASALPVEAHAVENVQLKTLVERTAFFEANNRNAFSPIAANSSSEKSERSPAAEYFISVTSATFCSNSVFVIFCQTFAVLCRTVCDPYRCREQESKDGRAGLAEMRDIDRSTSDRPRLCFDGA